MISRSSAALALCYALLACDRPSPERRPERQPEPPATPTLASDNGNASRSIMQADVIAETQATPEPTPTPTPAPLPGAMVTFASGTRLDEPARAAIDRLLGDPALPNDARFVLRGHSDSRGSDADNLLASRRRALAVRTYLAGKGIAADRVQIIALGERRPVAPNALPNGDDDPSGRARNRRVDIEVIRTSKE